jgi:hypothetical protein
MLKMLPQRSNKTQGIVAKYKEEEQSKRSKETQE